MIFFAHIELINTFARVNLLVHWPDPFSVAYTEPINKSTRGTYYDWFTPIDHLRVSRAYQQAHAVKTYLSIGSYLFRYPSLSTRLSCENYILMFNIFQVHIRAFWTINTFARKTYLFIGFIPFLQILFGVKTQAFIGPVSFSQILFWNQSSLVHWTFFLLPKFCFEIKL